MKEANQTQICGHAPATYDGHTTRSPRSNVSVFFLQIILLELFTENDRSITTRSNSNALERSSDRVIEAFLLPVNDKFPSFQYQKKGRSILISKQPN